MHKTTFLYQNVLEEENQSHQARFPSTERTMKGIAGGKELLLYRKRYTLRYRGQKDF